MGTYEKSVSLKDGCVARLRFVRPEDKDLLLDGFHHLGEESRRNRFFVPLGELTPSMLRYLTEVDGVNHVAIVATGDSLDLKADTGLGIARFVRLPEEPTVAEPAVTVAEGQQGRGLGSILLRELVELARERGVRTFRSYVLATNAPMLHLLQGLHARVTDREPGPEGEAVLTLDLDLDDVASAGALEQTLLWRVFQAIARTWAKLRGAAIGG